MIYMYTKFHWLNPDGSLVIAFEPKVIENVNMATMLLFYILQNIILTKVANLLPHMVLGSLKFEYLLCCHY